ncbi:hypothetical protein Tco_1444155, partial [Tanacetum coccineum]
QMKWGGAGGSYGYPFYSEKVKTRAKDVDFFVTFEKQLDNKDVISRD